MVKVDERYNEGEHRARIADAFGRHGIMLGAAAMTAPSAALAGLAPEVREASATLAAETVNDLRARIGAKRGAKFEVRPLHMFGEGIVEALHRREVPLGDLDSRLKGVIAYATESVLVGPAA